MDHCGIPENVSCLQLRAVHVQATHLPMFFFFFCVQIFIVKIFIPFGRHKCILFYCPVCEFHVLLMILRLILIASFRLRSNIDCVCVCGLQRFRTFASEIPEIFSRNNSYFMNIPNNWHSFNRSKIISANLKQNPSVGM